MKIRDESPDCSFQHTAQQETEKLKPMQKGLYRCEKLSQLFFLFFKKFLFLSARFLCLLTVPNESLLPDRSPRHCGTKKAPLLPSSLRTALPLQWHMFHSSGAYMLSMYMQFCPSPSPDRLAHDCLWEHLHLCSMPVSPPCAPVRQKSLIKWKC